MTSTVVGEEIWVENGDVRLRVEIAGEGPTLLCVPGFPELASSWRHQVRHFVERRHRVAVMDVRGYGGSSSPADPERYVLRELAGDVAAVIRSLGGQPVVLLGHDWGAPIVWHTAVRHPELVRGVAGLSVPYTTPNEGSLTDLLDLLYPDRFFYMLHFQEPGVAEAEFAVDTRAALKKMYYALSGDAPDGSFTIDAGRDSPMLPLLPEPPAGPLPFLDDAELDRCAEAFERHGMTGPLNRYRALPFEPAATTDIRDAHVRPPSCFVAGTRDLVRRMVPGADLYGDPGKACADFRGTTLVEGVGHWVQQEAPDQVNAALDAFLAGL